MLEGKSRPVIFEPDITVLQDSGTKQNYIYYRDQLDIRQNFVNTLDLKRGTPAKAVIQKPTFFGINADRFLVYPGEKIKVVRGQYNDFKFIPEKHKNRRNNELLFFTKFNEIEKTPVTPYLIAASIDSILYLETYLKNKIPQVSEDNQLLFDSLKKVLKVSRKFNRLTRNYLKNRYDLSLVFFYQQYAGALKRNGLYRTRMIELLPYFNELAGTAELENKTLLLNDFIRETFSLNISKISNENQIRNAWDTVTNYFNGITRDYLLSQLMYYALTNEVAIPAELAAGYKVACREKRYKNLIVKHQEQHLINEKLAKLTTGNLLFPDGIKTTNLRHLMTTCKGKIVVLDFWAHWCGPCLEEMTAVKTLAEEYKNKNIVFIKISIDKEIQPWRKALIAGNDQTVENYLLLNYKAASIVMENEISSIPRYMILDKEGKMVNNNAPRPGDPKLKIFLNKMLSK
jgi:thiol-disulfide isomerase/thioredoxin